MKSGSKRILKSIFSEDFITAILLFILSLGVWNYFFRWKIDILIFPAITAFISLVYTVLSEFWHYKSKSIEIHLLYNFHQSNQITFYGFIGQMGILYLWQYFFKTYPQIARELGLYLFLVLNSVDLIIFYFLLKMNWKKSLILITGNKKQEKQFELPYKITWFDIEHRSILYFVIGLGIFFLADIIISTLISMEFISGNFLIIDYRIPLDSGINQTIDWSILMIGRIIIQFFSINFLNWKIHSQTNQIEMQTTKSLIVTHIPHLKEQIEKILPND